MKEEKLSRYNIKGISQCDTVSGMVKNGFDNLFPNYLSGVYNKSITHQSIINDVTGYIVGYGLKATNPRQQALIDKYFNKKLLKKIVLFKRIFEQVNLELIKNPLNDLTNINVINPDQVRVKKIVEGDPVSFDFKKDWQKGGSKGKYEFKGVDWNEFLTDEWVDDKKGEPLDRALYHWYDSGTFDVPYGRPKYLAGLDAIELEIGIYMMHNNGVQNGMFPSILLTRISSGDVEQDERDAKITQSQVTGPANGGKIVQLFVKPGQEAPVLSTPNMSGIDKVYESQYATSESGILKAHSIPSPSLIAGLNVKPTGFASPEDEMQWAKNELMAKIVKPEREEILEILEPIFRLLEIEGATFEEVENSNSTVVGMSKEKDVADELIELGEDEDLEEWELLDEREVNYDEEEILDAEIQSLNNPQLSVLKLVNTGTARPNAKSEQDRVIGDTQFKVRYVYDGSKSPEREFCKKMMAANKLYRKEDIMRMEHSNPQFAPKGMSTYSVWLYSGGAYCKHRWLRRTYIKKGTEGSIDVNNPNAQRISTGRAQRMGYRVDNDPKVSMKPHDMPNQGRLNLSSIIQKIKTLNVW